MKRWVAALVTVLFLATATLHVFAHHSEADDSCKVCQVQASTAPAAASPHVVVVQTIEFVAARLAVPPALAVRVVVTPARAPPALPA